MTRLNVALIGLGKMGSLHLQALNKLKQEGLVDKIVCVDIAPRENIASLCDELHRCSYDKYTPKNIDIAFIATPTITHESAICRMLEYNVHVFVEKPAVTDINSLHNIVNAARRRDVRIFAGHIERVNTVVRFIKDSLANDKQPISIVTIRFNKVPAAPINYVNVLWDLLIHDIDIVVYLLDIRDSRNVDIVSRILQSGTENIPYKCHVHYLINKSITVYSTAGWVQEDYALRRLTVICEDHALEADLYTRTIIKFIKNREIELINLPPDDPVYQEDKIVLEGLVKEEKTILDLENLTTTYELIHHIEKGL